MNDLINATIAGRPFQFLPDRGLHWPDQKTLFVADTHFGKDATFRHHGVPVPAGATDATIDAIDRMISATRPSRLVILGDVFHARCSLSSRVGQRLTTFFERHPQVRFSFIRGNHDARIAKLPSAWPVEWVSPGEILDQVVLSHHPGKVPEHASLMLCGHLHPAVRVGSHSDQLGKIPCFWLSERCLVLPAIGQFTGTHAVTVHPTDRVWLVVDGKVLPYGTTTHCST